MKPIICRYCTCRHTRRAMVSAARKHERMVCRYCLRNGQWEALPVVVVVGKAQRVVKVSV